MSQGYAYGKIGVSGQRSGLDRRERDFGPPDGVERRGRQERRQQWSPFNEWTSTLKRKTLAEEDPDSSA